VQDSQIARSSAPASACAARQSRKGVGHHQGRGGDLREQGGKSADETERQRDDSTTSVIGGSSAFADPAMAGAAGLRSPAILAASQRLSVNVIIETIAAAGGAISERAATQRSTSPEDAASRGPRIRNSPRRSVPVMASASVPERQHGRNGCERGKARDPEQDAADRVPFELRCSRRGAGGGRGVGYRPAEQREMTKPPAGSATVKAKATQ